MVEAPEVTETDCLRLSAVAEEAAKASREALESARELVSRLGHLNGREGISLLEVKNRDLLAYTREMALLMASMSLGESIQDSPALHRSVKQRVMLERVRAMEKKMSSQIERLSQAGAASHKETLRARPDHMELDDNEEEGGEEGEEKNDEDKEGRLKKYVPPKVMAVHYDEHENARDERKRELARKRALQSSLVQELKQQYSDAPEEITERRMNRRSTKEKEQQEYEEEFFMRLQLNKKEKAARRKEEREDAFDSLLKFGDYMAGDEDDVRRREAARGGGPSRGMKRRSSRGGPRAKRGRGGGGGGGRGGEARKGGKVGLGRKGH